MAPASGPPAACWQGHKRGRSLGQALLALPSSSASAHGNHSDRWPSARSHGDLPASKRHKQAPPAQISDQAPPPADARDTYSLPPLHHPQRPPRAHLDPAAAAVAQMPSPAACPNFPPAAPGPAWLPLPPSSWNGSAPDEMRGRSTDMPPRRDSSHHPYGAGLKQRPQLPPLAIGPNGAPLSQQPMHPSMFPPTPALSQTDEHFSFNMPPPTASITPVSFHDGSRPSSASPLKPSELLSAAARRESLVIESYVDLEEGQYWYDDSDLVDPNLSLGEIVWRPGVLIYSAMPASHDAAESWAKHPVPRPKPNSRQTISKYIAADQSNLVKRCIPVQQTQEWLLVRDDPIFQDLSATLSEDEFCRFTAGVTKVPVHKVLHARRASMATPVNHRVPGQARPGRNSAPPRFHDEPQDRPQMDRRVRGMTPDSLMSLQQQTAAAAAPAPQPLSNPLSRNIRLAPPFEFKPTAALMDDSTGHHPAGPRARSASPQRSSSPTKIEMLMPDLKIPNKPSKPERPPKYERSQDQEDILAKLGVTGSPKAVYNVPGPARNPSPVRSRSASPDKDASHYSRPCIPTGSLTTICEDADPAGGPSGPAPAASYHNNVMGEISGNVHNPAASGLAGNGRKRIRHDSVDFGSIKRQRDGERRAMQHFQFPGPPQVFG